MEKKVAKKTEVKKKEIKKTVRKAPVKKVAALNKTTAAKKTTVKAVKPVEILKQTECKHCHKKYEEGLTICPFCKKGQKDRTGAVVITILSIILLISIICNYFVNKYYEEGISEIEYKELCKLASYEELVRSPKDYKSKKVKVIGRVVDVDGLDVSSGNMMTIMLDTNLFDGLTEQIISFEYIDRDYEIGFIEGDILTVYGEYSQINGNTPFIKAKYITFGT